MIRANLLPPPRHTARAFGMRFDVDHLRQCASGLALVALVAAIGCGIERARIDAARAQLAAARSDLAARQPERDVARGLALDVARYQEFARRAALERRSGADAAFAIARIGNAVPSSVWLDALDHDASGYAVSGESLTVAAVGGAILHLGASSPGGANLVSLDARGLDRRGIRFNAHLGDAANAATAAAP
jgi:hypothetical protein